MTCPKCSHRLMYDPGCPWEMPRMLCVCGFSIWQYFKLRKPTHGEMMGNSWVSDNTPSRRGEVTTC